MDLVRAKAEGVSLFTHKAGEGQPGFFDDAKFKAAMDRAHAANFPVVGAYYVNHPGDQTAQADHFIDLVSSAAPWWKDHPCFVWQIDAEKFNYMPRAPLLAEINAFGNRLVSRLGIPKAAVPVYAPKWLYGDGLRGLAFPNLWASAYVAGSGGFKSLYPGDAAFGWNAYSGITPTIWQYTSSATIAGQSPADANAVKVATVASLQSLFGGGGGGGGGSTDMSSFELIKVATSDAVFAFSPDGCWWGVPNMDYARALLESPLCAGSSTVSQARFDACKAMAAGVRLDPSEVVDPLKKILAALPKPPTATEITTIVTNALKAQPSITLTDEQVTALSTAVADAVVAKLPAPVSYTGDFTPKS